MKKIFVLFISFLSLSSLLFSQQAPTGFETLDYLYSISGKSTLAGQHGRNYWAPMRQIAGDYPALWGEDFLFYPSDGTSSMDEWRKLVVHDAKQHRYQGALIALMFHACPPTQPEPCDWNNDILNPLTNAEWQDLITDGTTLNNNWKARLDIIYPYLKELNDAGVEVLFRMFHEMNQGAFWWGGRPGPNGTAKLYQITHDYLVKIKGLTNLIWVWNLQDFSTLASDLTNYDPGSDYWDVLALDIYNSAGQGRYTTSEYNLIKNKAAGKPIAIGECDVLPTFATLLAQPDWTYFMGWADLVQSNNTNAAVKALYNSPNVLTLSKTGRAPVAGDNQDTLMVCNFDDVFPFVSTSGMSLDIADAPLDVPASGKIGVVAVPGKNTTGLLTIYLDKPIDPRNYVGISFLAQITGTGISPYFILKLEQSSDANNVNQIQDWTTYPKYTGNGNWQEVHLPFNVLLGSSSSDQLGYILNQNPNFSASYDKIAIAPAAYQNLSAFTVNIDDIRLRTSWDETGISSTIIADPILITAANGTINAKASSGNSVVLKVYSIAGQEIADGVNQVQIGTKGIYIVKAAAGNVSRNQKVAVQ